MQIYKKIFKDIDKLYSVLPKNMQDEAKMRFLIKSAVLKYLLNNEYIEENEAVQFNIRINFTINEIIKIWYGQYYNYLEEEPLTLDSKTWNSLQNFIDSGYSFIGLNSNILGFIYEYLNNTYVKKQKGIFYTPQPIIQHMISLLCIQWNKPFTIMDPACGSGFFLSEIYDKIKYYFDKEGIVWNIQKHQQIIETQLYGIELDPIGALITRLVLNLKNKAFLPVEHIYNEDALFINLQHTFDYVIGNPPYIGHKLLSKTYTRQLREVYGDIFYAKGDISYCFFKKGLDILNENGNLLYITSRYFLESLYAQGLRDYLQDQSHIDLIIDFNGNRVIKGAKVDLVIIKISKRVHTNRSIQVFKLYKEIKISNYSELFSLIRSDDSYKQFNVDQLKLKKSGWILIDAVSENIIEKIKKKCTFSLNNICTSHQGIITGCDKAFVIEKNKSTNYDPNILKPWIKNTAIQQYSIKSKGDYLIYTDNLENIEQQGYLYTHLLQYKDKLEKRRECKMGIRKWYRLQWGRNRSTFENKKIIFPYKACSNRFAIDTKGYYFSADIYSLTLENNLFNTYTYEFLVCLLNSKLYEFYFKTYAKKLGGSLYEYYPNTLMRLQIPVMDEGMDVQSKKYYQQIIQYKENEQYQDLSLLLDEINCYFYDLFQINIEERQIIQQTIDQ